MGRFKVHKPAGGNLKGFVPARLAEMRQRLGGIEVRVEPLGDTLATNQRSNKPGWMARIVIAEAAFDT